MDGLKTGYHTNDIDAKEWVVLLGNKHGDDNAACFCCDGVFSNDVRVEVWDQCYNVLEMKTMYTFVTSARKN